jgi:hypothetical protein
MKKGEWTFFTNHGRVFAYLAKHPRITTQKIAYEAGLSMGAVQNIITDLERGGYISRQKEGRQNRYLIHPDRPLRHRLEGRCAVGSMLAAMGWNGPEPKNTEIPEITAEVF